MDYITQEEYLLALAEALKYLNPKDATKVLQYYQTRINNAIDYGEKEESVIQSLPTPDEVAKQTYEAHGINYLQMRKKSYKRKMIFNKIIDSFLSIIIILAFIVVMSLIFKSLVKMGTLVYQLIKVEIGINKLISSFAVIGYMLAILIALIYVVDLFYILLSNFLNNIIDLKNQDLKRKIFTFTITGLIEDLTNHKKIQLKVLVCVVIVTIFLMAGSYLNHGYVASVLTDTPSNQIEVSIDDEITNINLDTAMANIYFAPSANNEFYLIYQYELNNHLNTTIDNQDLILSINNASSYDIFGLFNEPTPIITFYIPNNHLINMNLKMDSGVVDISNIELGEFSADIESKGTISMVGSVLNKSVLNGFNINYAIHSSEINDVSYTATKGQFIIEKNALINNLTVSNFQAKNKYTDSTITNAIINNSAGSFEMEQITGEKLNFTARTSQNYLTNVNYQEMEYSISNTCSLTINSSTAEIIKIEATNAYIIIDQLNATKLNITSNSSDLFLSNLGDKNSLSMEVNINQNSGSKTEVTSSTLKILSITQTKGYVICQNNYLKNAIFNLVKCKIVELVDLDGTLAELYLSEIDESITIDAKEKNDFVYLVKEWDLISAANLVKNEDTINFKVDKES